MSYKKTTVEFNTDVLMELVRNRVADAAMDNRPSLRDMEDVTGVSASTLSRIDKGNVPDMETFMKLCEYLGYIPDCFVLVEWTGQPISLESGNHGT